MKKVDIDEAEAKIDSLIEEAEKGEPFTISVDGKPLIKVSHMPKKELDKLPKPSEVEDELGN